MIVYYHPACVSYSYGVHVERPERVRASVERLRESDLDLEWHEPVEAGEEAIRRAHDAALFDLVQREVFIDADTPSHTGIFGHARRCAGAALAAAGDAEAGVPAFCLMRPPGHHATHTEAMGFCYLNSVAIAALDALARGIARVAIWDFDAHHGNGTEDILYGREGALFVSVHQSPGYPGTGIVSRGNCRNFPVAPGTPSHDHRDVLRESWSVVEAFKPELVLISAGFDAYVRDPITMMALEEQDFCQLGGWVRESGLAAAAMLEGGYSGDLPTLIEAFLQGWAGTA